MVSSRAATDARRFGTIIDEGGDMRAILIAGFILILGLSGMTRPAAAADAALEQFFGSYVGNISQAPNEPLMPRDLATKISSHGQNGFRLEWTTVIYRADGPKRQSYAVNFSRTDRPGIFSSAMRNNLFGQSEPLDPLKGDPYLWAQLGGETLTVHAMLITDDGSYEMQTYERTLAEGGMILKFSRDHNGTVLRTIFGKLKRVAS
jgi:hypothetical protein